MLVILELQAKLARVYALEVALMWAWIVSMFASPVTIMLTNRFVIPDILSSALVIWFIVSYFGSPALMAFVVLKAFKYRWVELSIDRDEVDSKNLRISYIDQKGKQYTASLRKLSLREFDPSTLVGKLNRFLSLWVQFDSEEAIDNVLDMAFPRTDTKNLTDLEACARAFYPFEMILPETAFIIILFLSPELWIQILSLSVCVGIVAVYIFHYFHYPGLYLFQLKGDQVVCSAENPSPIEKFSGRAITAISIRSIKINLKKRRVSLYSLTKIYRVQLPIDSSESVKWFEAVVN